MTIRFLDNRCAASVVAVVLVLLQLGSFLQAEPEREKPNILFVFADDLGWTDVNVNDPLDRSF